MRRLMGLRVERIAIENPIGVLSTQIRPPEQIVQPWQFGVPVRKATCLWLDGLPPLVPTMIVRNSARQEILRPGPSPDRWRARSRTYPGFASAMADQWGRLKS